MFAPHGPPATPLASHPPHPFGSDGGGRLRRTVRALHAAGDARSPDPRATYAGRPAVLRGFAPRGGRPLHPAPALRLPHRGPPAVGCAGAAARRVCWDVGACWL